MHESKRNQSQIRLDRTRVVEADAFKVGSISDEKIKEYAHSLIKKTLDEAIGSLHRFIDENCMLPPPNILSLIIKKYRNIRHGTIDDCEFLYRQIDEKVIPITPFDDVEVKDLHANMMQVIGHRLKERITSKLISDQEKSELIQTETPKLEKIAEIHLTDFTQNQLIAFYVEMAEVIKNEKKSYYTKAEAAVAKYQEQGFLFDGWTNRNQMKIIYALEGKLKVIDFYNSLPDRNQLELLFSYLDMLNYIRKGKIAIVLEHIEKHSKFNCSDSELRLILKCYIHSNRPFSEAETFFNEAWKGNLCRKTQRTYNFFIKSLVQNKTDEKTINNYINRAIEEGFYVSDSNKAYQVINNEINSSSRRLTIDLHDRESTAAGGMVYKVFDENMIHALIKYCLGELVIPGLSDGHIDIEIITGKGTGKTKEIVRELVKEYLTNKGVKYSRLQENQNNSGMLEVACTGVKLEMPAAVPRDTFFSRRGGADSNTSWRRQDPPPKHETVAQSAGNYVEGASAAAAMPAVPRATFRGGADSNTFFRQKKAPPVKKKNAASPPEEESLKRP